MSRSDLSPYDLDLGSGRVHTHTVGQSGFFREEQRGLRSQLQSILCLSFSAIYDCREESPGDGRSKAFWDPFLGRHGRRNSDRTASER